MCEDREGLFIGVAWANGDALRIYIIIKWTITPITPAQKNKQGRRNFTFKVQKKYFLWIHGWLIFVAFSKEQKLLNFTNMNKF